MNLDSSGVLSSLTGTATKLAGSLKWVVIVLLVAAVFGVIWFIWDYLRKFNYTCVVFSKRGDAHSQDIGKGQHPSLRGQSTLITKGAYLKDKKAGVWYFQIGDGYMDRTIKHKMEAIDPKYVMPIGKKAYVFFRREGPSKFIPLELKLKKEEIVFEGLSEARKLWAYTKMQQSRDLFKKKDWTDLIQQYLPIITIMICGVLMLMMWAILSKKFDVIGSAAQALENAAKILSQSAVEVATNGPK